MKRPPEIWPPHFKCSVHACQMRHSCDDWKISQITQRAVLCDSNWVIRFSLEGGCAPLIRSMEEKLIATGYSSNPIWNKCIFCSIADDWTALFCSDGSFKTIRNAFWYSETIVRCFNCSILRRWCWNFKVHTMRVWNNKMIKIRQRCKSTICTY